MLEFKLQIYFEEYKNAPMISTSAFKRGFIKKHGEFVLLNELINMVMSYQYKTYGNLLGTGKSAFRNVEKGTYCKREASRKYSKFGTREERINRKLESKGE